MLLLLLPLSPHSRQAWPRLGTQKIRQSARNRVEYCFILHNSSLSKIQCPPAVPRLSTSGPDLAPAPLSGPGGQFRGKSHEGRRAATCSKKPGLCIFTPESNAWPFLPSRAAHHHTRPPCPLPALRLRPPTVPIRSCAPRGPPSAPVASLRRRRLGPFRHMAASQSDGPGPAPSVACVWVRAVVWGIHAVRYSWAVGKAMWSGVAVPTPSLAQDLDCCCRRLSAAWSTSPEAMRMLAAAAAA